MQLSDSKLFRQQCYVNGEWIDADGGGTIDVTNPVDNAVIGTVPKLGASPQASWSCGRVPRH